MLCELQGSPSGLLASLLSNPLAIPPMAVQISRQDGQEEQAGGRGPHGESLGLLMHPRRAQAMALGGSSMLRNHHHYCPRASPHQLEH
jgi:hypothetical protein